MIVGLHSYRRSRVNLMLGVRHVFVVLVGVVALGTTAHAGMMPVSPAGTEYRQSLTAGATDNIYTAESPSPLSFTSVMGLDLGAIQFVPGADDQLRKPPRLNVPKS